MWGRAPAGSTLQGGVTPTGCASALSVRPHLRGLCGESEFVTRKTGFLECLKASAKAPSVKCPTPMSASGGGLQHVMWGDGTFTPWQRATRTSCRALCRLSGAEAHRTYKDNVFWGAGETVKTGPRGLTSSPNKAEALLSSGDSEPLFFAAACGPLGHTPSLPPGTASGRFLPQSDSQRSPMSPTSIEDAGVSSHRQASGAGVQKGRALDLRRRHRDPAGSGGGGKGAAGVQEASACGPSVGVLWGRWQAVYNSLRQSELCEVPG